MSLCISFRTDNKIYSIADSQLTTTITKRDTGSLLPTDTEIVHTTPNAIKIQIASHPNSIYADRQDMVFNIAGNVSLGLQSVLHIDACLSGSPNLWAEHIPDFIAEKLWLFWNTSRDKNIECILSINDHKRKLHLFEFIGTEDKFEMGERKEENGILLSVIGDHKNEVREKILTATNSASFKLDVDSALYYASLRELLRAIEDESNVFVGGNMQLAVLENYNAQYLIQRRNGLFFRGAEIQNDEIVDIKTLDLEDEIFDLRLDFQQLLSE
jgi:hypothetical protein